MTLMELTGHEAGIVIYESGEVAVVNWGQYDDDQIPRLAPMLGMMGFPEDGILDNVPVSVTVEDVRDILPGKVWLDDGELETDMEILQDDNNDIIALFFKLENDDRDPDDLTSAEVYTLRDGTKIVAPHTWC